MVVGKTLQSILVLLFAVGFLIHIILYMRQSLSHKVQDDCQDAGRWCKSLEVATTCGVLEYCQLGWKKTGTFLNTTGTDAVSAPPVNVTVYYEVLCSDSIAFVTKQLYPTYQKLFGNNIFKADLVPYGNAKESKKGDKWEFSCQHGKAECIGNIIQSCAIHELKNDTRWMPFVFCMEKSKATVAAAKKCIEDQHFDYSIIEKCTASSTGNKLQHEMAVKTYSLKPKHTFIPWITINGKSGGLQTKALYNFLELICDTYEGHKPDACPD